MIIGSENLLSSLHGRVFSSCFGQSSLFHLYLSLSHITAPPPFCTSFWHYVGNSRMAQHCHTVPSLSWSNDMRYNTVLPRQQIQSCYSVTIQADEDLKSPWINTYTVLSFFYQTLFIWYWLSLSNSLNIFKKCIFLKKCDKYKWKPIDVGTLKVELMSEVCKEGLLRQQ